MVLVTLEAIGGLKREHLRKPEVQNGEHEARNDEALKNASREVRRRVCGQKKTLS